MSPHRAGPSSRHRLLITVRSVPPWRQSPSATGIVTAVGGTHSLASGTAVVTNQGRREAPGPCGALQPCQSGCSPGAVVKGALPLTGPCYGTAPAPREVGSHRPASLPTGPDAAQMSGSYSPKDSESQSDYKGENILDNAGSRLHRKKAKLVANVTSSPAPPSERRQRGEWGAWVRRPSWPERQP